MRINELGLALIKRFEGCRLTAYKDVGGVWTCGWGSTGGDIAEGTVWTQDEADRRLIDHLKGLETSLSSLVGTKVNQNQFSAILCFAYNVGLGALKGSHLLIKVLAGDIPGAADEFLRWDKVHGVVVNGLHHRREAERELFLN